MGKFIKSFIVMHSKGFIMAFVSAIIIGVIATIIIMQSGLEEDIAILEAGLSDVPIIKNDDLQELGRLYSELNDKFEREIDELVTGKANRNNKANKELKHYGVYGKENENPFKNDDYINGINLKYEKSNANIRDGASNFNDIIAVMSVFYDQQMDLVNISELKEVFTDLFWLSHTYTFDSTELYPCKSGCVAERNYKCPDVYKDYNLGRIKYLKYDPFTVRKHSNYEDYDPSEDFRIVYPDGQCVVCGKTGSGCIRDENKICYHGNSKVNFVDYNDKKSVKMKTVTVDGETEERKFEGPVYYAELGDIVVPEDIDEELLGPGPTIPTGEEGEELEPGAVTYGNKIDANNSSCYYYMEVKYCSERKRLSDKIATLLKDIDDIDDSINGAQDGADTSGLEEQKIAKEEEERELQAELNEHIANVCEANEAKAKSWCNGFKICLGHKTHYKCNGHKVVLCLGHTSINVTIKILYRDELLDEAFKVFR